MHRLSSLVAGIGALALLLTPFAAASQGKRNQKPKLPDSLRPFTGDLEAARLSSLERNVPILIIGCVEGEPENDTVRDEHLRDKELIAASQGALVLLLNDGTHDRRKITEHIGDLEVEREVCRYYATESCTDHQALFDQVYNEYHEEGVLRMPCFFVILPGGKVKWRKADGDVPSASIVTRKVKDAIKDAGPGLSQDELSRVKLLTSQARTHAQQKSWAKAWVAWQGILDIQKVGKYGDQAAVGRAEADERITAHIEALFKRLVPGSAVEAYRELSAYAEALVETTYHEELVKRIKKAERDKAVRDEIKAWRTEEEAKAVLEEAKAFFREGEERRGERAAKKLFKKKYAGTEAAAEAKRLYPHLLEVPE